MPAADGDNPSIRDERCSQIWSSVPAGRIQLGQDILPAGYRLQSTLREIQHVASSIMWLAEYQAAREVASGEVTYRGEERSCWSWRSGCSDRIGAFAESRASIPEILRGQAPQPRPREGRKDSTRKTWRRPPSLSFGRGVKHSSSAWAEGAGRRGTRRERWSRVRRVEPRPMICVVAICGLGRSRKRDGSRPVSLPP